MRQRRAWNAALCAVTLILSAACHADAIKLLVPAYWYTESPNYCTTASIGGAWKAVAAGGSNVIAIINPNSGPDYTRREGSVRCLPHLRRAGVTPIGYVATGYGKRSMLHIKRDIMEYGHAHRAAGMRGLFFDEGTDWWTSSAGVVSRYNSIARFARRHGFSFLVINSGIRFPPQFLALFNMVVGFENPGATWKIGNQQGICAAPYFTSRGDPGYCKGPRNCDLAGGNCRQARRGQVAALVLCQGSYGFRNIIRQAQRAGYGAVYVTDKGCRKSNPFATLPSYWTSEIQAALLPA